MARPSLCTKITADQNSTCADEHDSMPLSVHSQHTVHYDAGQQRAPPHQQRPSGQRPGSLVHEWPVPDELEGLVRKVQRSVHPHFLRHIINALKRETALSNFKYIKVLYKDSVGFKKKKNNSPPWLCCRLTAPGLGTGISPVYITHFM